MKIGIVGAGPVGANLAVRLGALGHEVSVANSRGPSTLRKLAAAPAIAPVEAAQAGVGADVVIVAVPTRSVPELPEGFLDTAAPGAAVIDTTNYYPRERDGRIAEIESGELESRWVSRQLGRPVVKAFNTLAAERILDAGRPSGTPGRTALPVAGDHPSCKHRVMRLIDDLGFDPLDAGAIDESWRQQPGTPSYDVLLTADALRRALAEASPNRPEQFRFRV